MIATFIIVIVSLVGLLIFILVHNQKVTGEMLDRIMALQALPPVTRKIPELHSGEPELKAPAPRERAEKDRVRFRLNQP